MYRSLAIRIACIMLMATAMYAQTGSPAAQKPPAATPIPLLDPPPQPPAKEKPREDWTTLSLAHSGLPLNAVGGTLLGKTELPDCTRELLRMQWRPNDPIDLYVIRPRGVEKPPLILYLNNYTVDSDIFRKDGWCKLVKQSGVAAIGFTSALSGQRFHSPRPMNQWFVSELQEALSTSTHDIQMILNYLDTRGDLDMKHVGIFGRGSGGSVAILAAVTDPRIVALNVIDPWGDWPEWLKASKQIPEEERAAYLKPEFLQKVSNLDPLLYLPQLKIKTVRIQQIMTDPVTPSTAKDRIAQAAPEPNDVIRYQTAMELQKDWTTNGASEWLKEQLEHHEP